MSRMKKIPNLDDLLRRYQAGESEKKLAAEAGINRWGFRDRLIKAGIAPRGRSAGMKARWSNATEVERNAMLVPAHAAVRGTTISDDIKARQAAGKQRALSHVSPLDIMLLNDLKSAGLTVTPQKAIHIYNIDMAVESPPVAVELFGGGWHTSGGHGLTFHKRTKYLLDSGWNVVIVWIDKRRYPLGVGCVEYIVALAKSLCLNPPDRSQYRVILGDGNLAPIAESYFNTPADIQRLCGG